MLFCQMVKSVLINDMTHVIRKLIHIRKKKLALACSDTGFSLLTDGQLFMTSFMIHIMCLPFIQEMNSVTLLQMVHQYLSALRP